MENATDKQIAFLRKKNIVIPDGLTKQDAHVIIDSIIGQVKEVAPVVKPGYKEEWYAKADAPKKSSQSSFYVAYAKDMFIAIYEKDPLDNRKGLMQDCIDMIKLAKEQL